MPPTELLPAAVITRPPVLLGEPGATCFQDWLSQQPADAELTQLASAVQQAETDFAAARSAIPKIVEARVQAEDDRNGAAFADATAIQQVMPPLIAKLAAHRVQANLRYLARLAVLAKRAAAQAEAARLPMMGDLANLRREMVTTQKGGRSTDRAAPLSSQTAMAAYQRAYREVSPADIAAQRAMEIVTLAAIRGRILDAAGDRARVDLMLPATWQPAILSASERASAAAQKEINAHGK